MCVCMWQLQDSEWENYDIKHKLFEPDIILWSLTMIEKKQQYSPN